MHPLQQTGAGRLVIATGEQHSIREFVTLAGSLLGLEINWVGAGLSEQG